MATISNEVKAGIYQQLGISKIYSTEKDKYAAIRLASSYAFYNAARKNANGEIEIKGENWMVRILLSIFMFVTLLAVCFSPDRWIFLMIMLGEILLFLGAEWLARRKKVIVDQQKIQIDKVDYYWKDYRGAYIVLWVVARTPTSRLILLVSDNSWISIPMPEWIDPNRLGTAIRDMEPASWKE